MARICLLQAPALLLRQPDGRNRSDALQNSGDTYQPLIGTLEAEDHEVTLIRMRRGDAEHKLGTVEWNGQTLHKIACGMSKHTLPIDDHDVFGVTSNFHVEREVVCDLITYVSAHGKPVIVGGSDAIADPDAYLRAGATVVVLDKSGGSNAGAIEVALTGKTDKPCWIKTKDGIPPPGRFRMRPDEWPLPSVEQVENLLGKCWRDSLPADRFPYTSIVFDQGCDQDCDFCMTRRSGPYQLGYQFMSLEAVAEWLDLQVEAGAKTVNSMSDQILGRMLWNGRDEIINMMRLFRERELTWMIRNGFELSKLTVGVTHGHDLRGHTDPTPDQEIVDALLGPDCIQAYVPLERPLEGTGAYAKLLPWQHSLEMCRAVVRSGAPDLLFGVIIGQKEDSEESMQRLDEALFELRHELLKINPDLRMSINPTVIILFPGIPMTDEYKALGLMPQDPDPAIVSKYTPLARTLGGLDVDDVLHWQKRLAENHMDRDADGKTRWHARGSTAY